MEDQDIIKWMLNNPIRTMIIIICTLALSFGIGYINGYERAEIEVTNNAFDYIKEHCPQPNTNSPSFMEVLNEYNFTIPN